MMIYFVKYTEGTEFRKANSCDKNCDKNRVWHKNQYIHGTGITINNRNKKLGEFIPILV